MPLSCGSLLFVQVDVGAGYETIGATQTDTLSFTRETTEITTKDSGGYRELINCGVGSVSFSDNGFIDLTSTGLAFAILKAHSGELVDTKLISEQGDYYEGQFQFVAVERAGEHNSAETFSLTGESAGLVTRYSTDPDAFRTTWTTPSDAFTINFPTYALGTYSGTINWGDGSGELSFSSYNDANFSHTYATAGTYLITVSGTFTQFYLAYGAMRNYLVSVNNIGATGMTTGYNAFSGAANNLSFDVGDNDLSSMTSLERFLAWNEGLLSVDFTDMSCPLATTAYLFMHRCYLIESIDFAGLYTPLLENARDLISYNTALTSVNFAGLEFGLVTNAISMMANCPNITHVDLSPLDTSSLENWSNMFDQDISLTTVDVTGVDITAATNFTYFLRGVTLTTENYGDMLVAFEAQDVNDNVIFYGGNSKYNATGAVARAALIADHNWTIVDGGAA